MPLCLEPGAVFPVVLDSDAKKPVDQRPTLYCKAVSARGMLQLEAFLDADNYASTEERLTAYATEILRHCDKWQNFDGELTVDNLLDSLHYWEMREVLKHVMLNQYVQDEEKKS